MKFFALLALLAVFGNAQTAKPFNAPFWNESEFSVTDESGNAEKIQLLSN